MAAATTTAGTGLAAHLATNVPWSHRTHRSPRCWRRSRVGGSPPRWQWYSSPGDGSRLGAAGLLLGLASAGGLLAADTTARQLVLAGSGSEVDSAAVG